MDRKYLVLPALAFSVMFGASACEESTCTSYCVGNPTLAVNCDNNNPVPEKCGDNKVCQLDASSGKAVCVDSGGTTKPVNSLSVGAECNDQFAAKRPCDGNNIIYKCENGKVAIAKKCADEQKVCNDAGTECMEKSTSHNTLQAGVTCDMSFESVHHGKICKEDKTYKCEQINNALKVVETPCPDNGKCTADKKGCEGSGTNHCEDNKSKCVDKDAYICKNNAVVGEPTACKHKCELDNNIPVCFNELIKDSHCDADFATANAKTCADGKLYQCNDTTHKVTEKNCDFGCNADGKSCNEKNPCKDKTSNFCTANELTECSADGKFKGKVEAKKCVKCVGDTNAKCVNMRDLNAECDNEFKLNCDDMFHCEGNKVKKAAKCEEPKECKIKEEDSVQSYDCSYKLNTFIKGAPCDKNFEAKCNAVAEEQLYCNISAGATQGLVIEWKCSTSEKCQTFSEADKKHLLNCVAANTPDPECAGNHGKTFCNADNTALIVCDAQGKYTNKGSTCMNDTGGKCAVVGTTAQCINKFELDKPCDNDFKAACSSDADKQLHCKIDSGTQGVVTQFVCPDPKTCALNDPANHTLKCNEGTVSKCQGKTQNYCDADGTTLIKCSTAGVEEGTETCVKCYDKGGTEAGQCINKRAVNEKCDKSFEAKCDDMMQCKDATDTALGTVEKATDCEEPTPKCTVDSNMIKCVAAGTPDPACAGNNGKTFCNEARLLTCNAEGQKTGDTDCANDNGGACVPESGGTAAHCINQFKAGEKCNEQFIAKCSATAEEQLYCNIDSGTQGVVTKFACTEENKECKTNTGENTHLLKCELKLNAPVVDAPCDTNFQAQCNVDAEKQLHCNTGTNKVEKFVCGAGQTCAAHDTNAYTLKCQAGGGGGTASEHAINLHEICQVKNAAKELYNCTLKSILGIEKITLKKTYSTGVLTDYNFRVASGSGGGEIRLQLTQGISKLSFDWASDKESNIQIHVKPEGAQYTHVNTINIKPTKKGKVITGSYPETGSTTLSHKGKVEVLITVGKIKEGDPASGPASAGAGTVSFKNLKYTTNP